MSKPGTNALVTEPVFLTGFMGVGKSTVGRLVAGLAGIPFEDSDHWVERKSGLRVAEIFARMGEPEFRRLEREAIAELASREACVIGLGGGAILDPENQKRILSAGRLVWLEASPETLLERAQREPGARPLLGDPSASRAEKLARVRSLLDARKSAYGLAEIRIATEGKAARQVAEEIMNWLKTRPKK